MASAAQAQVASAIKDLSVCKPLVKEMLLAALPNAFGADLHPFQKEAASMLRKCLEEACAAVEKGKVDTTQSVKESQAVLDACQADVASITAAEEAARSILNAKLAEFETAQAVVKTEEVLCEEAATAKVEVAAKRRKIEAAKAEVESVQNGSFRMLLDGGWEDEEVRDACIDAVCNYLSTEGADAVLLAALPKALGHRPADSGAFDKLAGDEALRLFSEKVAGYSNQLTEGEQDFDDATAEHLGAWAISDVAREKEIAAGAERDSANAALKKTIADKKLALSKVTEQNKSLASALSEATLMEANVQQLDLSLKAFAALEAGVEIEKEDKDIHRTMAVVDEVTEGNEIPVEHVTVAAVA